MALPQQFAGAQSTADADLMTGIRQVQGGEFDAALITLDGVVRRLFAQKSQANELARAYTYLAIAYKRLDQEEPAKGKLREAWKADKSMTLSPKEFPPDIIQLFEQVKKEGQEKPSTGVTPVARTDTKTPQKGGGHTGLILLGVGAAVGIGVAVAAGSGGSSTPPTTLTPPAATLADLSASVVSPQFNTNLICTENVSATVSLTNRARSSVTVSGVRSENKVTSGRCNPGPPFIDVPLVSSVGPGSTATLRNGPLFTGGSGCCNSAGFCDGRDFCQFQQVFTILTSVGELNAGAIGFGVTFKGCVICSSSAAQAFRCGSPP
jgi:hypothetical protein